MAGLMIGGELGKELSPHLGIDGSTRPISIPFDSTSPLSTLFSHSCPLRMTDIIVADTIDGVQAVICKTVLQCALSNSTWSKTQMTPYDHVGWQQHCTACKLRTCT
jgi:hypothetical protein